MYIKVTALNGIQYHLAVGKILSFRSYRSKTQGSIGVLVTAITLDNGNTYEVQEQEDFIHQAIVAASIADRTALVGAIAEALKPGQVQAQVQAQAQDSASIYTAPVDDSEEDQ